VRRALAAVLFAALLVPAAAPAAQSQPKYLNKQYSDTVHDLRDCLNVLSANDRRIVVLRSGIGPQDPASPQQVAAKVGISVASVAKAQWAPVHQMRAAQKAGRCGTTAKAPASTPVAKKTVATPSATVAEPADKAGWSSPKVLILLGIAGFCLLGVLREVLGAIRA